MVNAKRRFLRSLRFGVARGLTLVEMTLVLAITAVFIVFVGNALLTGVTAYTSIGPTLASQAQLRYALDRISREVREVATVVATPRTYDFTFPVTPTNNSNRIVFVKNDGNTVTIDGSSGSAVNMSYTVPAATGRLADIAATNALAINFYDHNINGVTASTGYATYSSGTANLGSVEITLTVTVEGVASSATTRVALRGTQ